MHIQLFHTWTIRTKLFILKIELFTIDWNICDKHKNCKCLRSSDLFILCKYYIVCSLIHYKKSSIHKRLILRQLLD